MFPAVILEVDIEKGLHLLAILSAMKTQTIFTVLLSLVLVLPFAHATPMDLSQAQVVTNAAGSGASPPIYVRVLREEIASRTGITPDRASAWPASGPVIAVVNGKKDLPSSWSLPDAVNKDLAGLPAESYAVHTDITNAASPVVWLCGADTRGALYAVGRFLRTMDWHPNRYGLAEPLDCKATPTDSIRGHQLGYRNTANSWDSWTPRQYEQYIRELALTGSNSIEGIPFQGQKSPLMKLTRPEMNKVISQICDTYDMDYWVWTPADFDLRDKAKRAQALKDHEELYRSCPRLNAVFVAGGDPGNNPPELVMPYMEDLAKLLKKYHPKAKLWLSLQGYNAKWVNEVYDYINAKHPTWLAGLVAGPSSPPIPETRRRLPKEYKLRRYPDVTHSTRCQYPVEWWDPAFALTEGRECSNPRPVFYAHIYKKYAAFCDGFLSYSDGVHDDVNKVLWNSLAWSPQPSVRDILVGYARLFFGPDVAEDAADGILALERNWKGPALTNGGIDATLVLWQKIEQRAPQLDDNWRFQLCLLRAYYDAYDRARLLYEKGLEDKANAILAEAPSRGADAAMDAVSAVLKKSDTDPVHQDWRQRIVDLCAALNKSIGLQTSVKKYQASGEERGCILDFLDYPLNNRWWLHDQFDAIRKLPSEKDKLARLHVIATWDHPGPGSFYDNLGHVGAAPDMIEGKGPTQAWWDNGMSRTRLSWQCYMDEPFTMDYTALDSDAKYVLRVAGLSEAIITMDGKPILPTVYHKGLGEFKEFPVPADLIQDGELLVHWSRPDESTMNWRQYSRVSDMWLLKKP